MMRNKVMQYHIKLQSFPHLIPSEQTTGILSFFVDYSPERFALTPCNQLDSIALQLLIS